ncbi:dynactin P62 subunit [Culex quinquefasciatus]|uniref:Dynactin P62 subunit n=1 Tax=Culex quinquefasciatus TaxID=7176 RepID=B0XBW6_CULQU|nr:dynactin P62 subunit [Culex quinquefasciatus]|eukprot:XP_001867138.1 dynactin P62 subunit [Culex quinquefasciatus]
MIRSHSMFVAVMAFFARISDPAVGETYMTLLNTLSNLGGNWPITVWPEPEYAYATRFGVLLQYQSVVLHEKQEQVASKDAENGQVSEVDGSKRVGGVDDPSADGLDRSGTSEAVDELLEDLLTKPIQLKNITTRQQTLPVAQAALD